MSESKDCCSKDLWKNPKKTICFLICFNLGYFYLRNNKIGMISLCLTLTLYKILFCIVVKKLNISFCNCNCNPQNENQEEKLKKTEDCFLKGINKINDIVEMKENADYKIVFFCILLILFGENFSTLSVFVLGVDIYVLLHYGTLKDKIKEYYNKYSQMVVEKIPKYKGEKID